MGFRGCRLVSPPTDWSSLAMGHQFLLIRPAFQQTRPNFPNSGYSVLQADKPTMDPSIPISSFVNIKSYTSYPYTRVFLGTFLPGFLRTDLYMATSPQSGPCRPIKPSKRSCQQSKSSPPRQPALQRHQSIVQAPVPRSPF